MRVFWGLYCGPLVLGNNHEMSILYFPTSILISIHVVLRGFGTAVGNFVSCSCWGAPHARSEAQAMYVCAAASHF